MEEKKMTGYPSIDKPWLKYYSEEASNAKIPECTMYDYIYDKNKEHLDDIALIYFGHKISYGELFQNIHKAEAAFLAAGVKPGDVVSFISITTPELVYCTYAINKIGAIANMLDPRSSDKTLIHQISLAESKVLVILDQCQEKLNAIRDQLSIDQAVLIELKSSMGLPIKQFFVIKTMFAQKHNCQSQYVKWADFLARKGTEKHALLDDVGNASAFIWYTGGTTGEAKGVLLSNLNINSVAEQYRLIEKNPCRQQTWLTVSAPFIAYSFICGLHLPLALGLKCCIELYDPKAIADTIVKKKYNHAAVTPIVWENIIRNPKSNKVDFSFLVAPISGADYMNPKLEQEINDFFSAHNCEWKICQGYGMTEVGSGVAVCSSNDHYKSGSVGIPFPHTTISTFDIDTGDELPTGEVGEICISGPSVMVGYYRNSDATNTAIQTHKDGRNWMHTGDLGKIDSDGNLFITGRLKRMITRYDGFKVFPAMIEEKIMMHDSIAKCCVVGQDDPRSEGGQLPAAFLALQDTKNSEESVIEEIKQLCETVLPEYAWPVQYYIRDSIPLTPAGKIDYRVLEEKAKKYNHASKYREY